LLRSLEDRKLVTLAVRGRSDAFGELVRRHASPVRSLLRRLGAQPALADDLAQDTFVIAFTRIATFRNEGPFRPWLSRIAARLYVKHWRANSRIDLYADLSSYVIATGAQSADSERMDLDKALQSLAAAERVCISLCHGAGFSHSEVAQELRMPLGTVKSHVSRGLIKLRKLLATRTTIEVGDDE
jgi:RNA polymerase sigma-70 factor (ECF subfamily)